MAAGRARYTSAGGGQPGKHLRSRQGRASPSAPAKSGKLRRTQPCGARNRPLMRPSITTSANVRRRDILIPPGN